MLLLLPPLLFNIELLYDEVELLLLMLFWAIFDDDELDDGSGGGGGLLLLLLLVVVLFNAAPSVNVLIHCGPNFIIVDIAMNLI